MDMNLAFQIAMSLVAFFGGWFMKVLFSRIEQLEKTDAALAKTVNDMRVDLPTHYVSKNDFHQALDNIHAALRRIEDKIDSKADKE